MLSNLKKQINKYEIISFDIFDTLIVRAYNKPTDLFKHIELSKKIPKFCKKRIEAEQQARKDAALRGIDEINIDEIYNRLPFKYQYLKEVEITQEINVCTQDKYMFEIFNYALQQGKKVIISSDMYLPKSVIEVILKNNNYVGYEKLFLSSDILHSKASGKMFTDIMSYFNVSPNKILHIGDNIYGDYNSPKAKGIEAFLYKSAKEINSNVETSKFLDVLKSRENEISISIAKSLILNRNFENHKTLEDFGYKYAGLMVTGYCAWLESKFKEKRIKNIIFNSRDGYIPMQIFKQFYPEFSTQYLYTSRRAYLFSGLKKIKDILEYLVDQIGSNITFKDYWNSLHVYDNEIENIYKKSFNQDEIITENHKKQLKQFFIDNENLFLKYAEKERKTSISYFEKMNILNKKVAMVDIGWRASIQRNIIKTIKLAKRSQDIHGYYLATHTFKQKYVNLEAYLMNQNKPKSLANIINPLISILELIFSAPHLGCVKIVEKDGDFVPLLTKENNEENIRMSANQEIYQGIMDFAKDYFKVINNLPIEISPESAVTPFIDFFNTLSKEIQYELGKIGFITGCGDLTNYSPIINYYPPKSVIGIIYTWPGASPNAEAEFLYRLLKTKQSSFNLVLISNQGYILDSNLRLTSQKINIDSLKFVISIHYEDSKMLDAFYYHTLWNPPHTTLQYSVYIDLMKNVISCDDFLAYDNGGMMNHLKAMLINSPRMLENHSTLTASLPESSVKNVNLENPKLFYCGVNWEKMIGTEPRHEGLFKFLDTLDYVKFFGPESTWEGFANYKGKIPFDGFSLLEEANKCGVVLALSSKWHYRAGAATNRIYEGCASGCVIITDDNPFIKKHFGDSVLYIDFDVNNPQKMFTQIKNHMDWICSNKEEATNLAKKSQKIFLEKFSLEKQLKEIIDNHENRENAVADSLYSKSNEKILMLYFADSESLNRCGLECLENTINNVKNQVEKYISFIVCCDEKCVNEIQNFISNNNYDMEIKIKPFKIYNENGYKLISRCQMLYEITKQEEFSYFCVLNGNEILFKEHITTLKRVLEEDKSLIASYGGTFLDSVDNNRYRILNRAFNVQEIYNGLVYDGHYILSGNFLMRKDILSLLPEYVHQYIDGFETVAMLNLATIKFSRAMKYSLRRTCVTNEKLKTDTERVLDFVSQLNLIKGLVQYEYEQLNVLEEKDYQMEFLNFSMYPRYIIKAYIRKLKFDRILLRLRKLIECRKQKRRKIKEKLRQKKEMIKLSKNIISNLR